jgi:hypothetical protein
MVLRGINKTYRILKPNIAQLELNRGEAFRFAGYF